MDDGIHGQGGRVKILIGYDGSTASDRALQGLAHAGLPTDTQALVATVTNPWPDVGLEAQAGASYGIQPPLIADHAIKEAENLANNAAHRLRKRFPTRQVEAESILGRPAQALLDKADAWAPDLIVLGSRGRSGIGKLVLGSVSLRILHHAKTDVRISRLRAGRRKSAAVRNLVGTDGSAGAGHAVAAVGSREWPEGTAVRVLAVIDWRDLPSALLRSENSQLREKTRRSMHIWIESRVESASRMLGRKGLKATHDVLLGDPRHVLLRESRAWRADCIFVGSRGLNAIDLFLIGSISSAVASHAPCSVEVIRKARAARELSRMR